jgi:F-type H+-transporting ATPase subunit alpha
MAIRAAEISDIIRQQLKDYTKSLEVRETGTVLSTGDGIARIYGLERAAVGELLAFPHDIFGMVLNLEEDNVGAALFGEAQAIGEGDEVRRTAASPRCQSGRSCAVASSTRSASPSTARARSRRSTRVASR